MNRPANDPAQFIKAMLDEFLPAIEASRRREAFIAAAIIGVMAGEQRDRFLAPAEVADRAIAVANAVLELELEASA